MNIKGEDSSSAGALNAFNEEFSAADVIMSVEIVEAEYDGDVMMSSVFLWLTSSDPLRQTMSC
ncbi:hypothetical protein F511_38972 [Dorcoceras hygrometricum]|uniref:Uncharacterized protein n=1 Tax=Dorcoceras hygrometricum TaxID=472368 RepID=A0A2Z7A8I5_9LAMI|nr:hypothetical protein F511_38972 [Dorcoceras hygrometricum]